MIAYQLTEQQIVDANAFMAPRYVGSGWCLYLDCEQFTFTKVGDDIVLTDTETDETVNLGPEVIP